MIEMAKNEVFGNFLEFDASDLFDITHFDRNKQCARFGHRITHVQSFKNKKNPNDPNSQKLRFWPFSSVWCIRSI